MRQGKLFMRIRFASTSDLPTGATRGLGFEMFLLTEEIADINGNSYPCCRFLSGMAEIRARKALFSCSGCKTGDIWLDRNNQRFIFHPRGKTIRLRFL